MKVVGFLDEIVVSTLTMQKSDMKNYIHVQNRKVHPSSTVSFFLKYVT